MDWSKSKNIILIVLAMTNIFLFVVYTQRTVDDSEDGDENVYQYTMNVLEENNIFYEGEIYSHISKMRTLTVSYSQYDRDTANNVINDFETLPEERRNEAGYKTAADTFLESCGFMSENVNYEGIVYDETIATVSYGNNYENIPVEECYIRVYFEEGRITDFDRKWIEVVSESESKTEVLSQLSALLKFMTETDKSERITVTDMYLVYWVDNYDPDSDVLYDTALPAWCLKYNDGQVKYISATVQ